MKILMIWLMAVLPLSAVVMTREALPELPVVGDVVTLNLTVSFDQAPQSVEGLPLPDRLSESLIIQQQGPLRQVSDTVYQWPLRVQLLGVGELDVPTLSMSLIVGGNPITAGLSAGTLSVQSVVGVSESPDSLKPSPLLYLKGQLVWYWRYAWLGLVVVLIAVGTSVAIWKRRGRSVVETAVQKTPLEIALSALKKLSAQPITGHGSEVAFCLELTKIVKQYYEFYFHISLLDTTTSECLSLLKPRLMTRFYGAMVMFLNQCDEIKFAKGGLTRTAHKDLLEQAKNLVRGMQ